MDQLEQITGLKKRDRDRLCLAFGRMSEVERLDLLILQTDLFRQCRDRLQPLPAHERVLAALVMALRKREQTSAILERKQSLSEPDAVRLHKMKLDEVLGKRRARKEGSVQRFIRLHYPLIQELRTKGLSWREVSIYLAKNHKNRISHTMLRVTFERLATVEKGLQEDENAPNCKHL